MNLSFNIQVEQLAYSFLWGTFIVQMIYYWLIFRHLARIKIVTQNINNDIVHGNQVNVSVIICAKNEATNLLQNLPAILSQNHQTFEVIVVNDGSSDETAQILYELRQHYEHLHVINLKAEERKLKGKKYALHCGIIAAKYDFLVLTDADCQPATDQWLRCMTYGINEKANSFIYQDSFLRDVSNTPKIVTENITLGYSPYSVRPTWLNACVQYETFMTAMQYLSYALCSMPYMGVGRNIAYSKHLYTQHGGFMPHAEIASGDDDLFINRVANRNNTTVMLHPDSFCYSKPPDTWQQWIRQKKRHLSTATRYRLLHQLLLGVWSLAHFLFTILLIILIIHQPHYWTHYLFVFSLKIALQFPVYYPITQSLRCQVPIWKLLLIDSCWFIYYIFFSLAVLQPKTTQWK